MSGMKPEVFTVYAATVLRLPAFSSRDTSQEPGSSPGIVSRQVPAQDPAPPAPCRAVATQGPPTNTPAAR